MRFCCLAPVMLCLLFSCSKPAAHDPGLTEPSGEEAVVRDVSPRARPVAVLQAGEYPLWFQLSDDGPALLGSIDEACFSAAFIPWPLAPHIPYMLARGDELFMASNRDGLYRLAPWSGADGGIGLYHVSGGEFWRQYTVGAFVWYEGMPAALLYLDDRFLDTGAALPAPRVWTLDQYSIALQPLRIPALDMFPPEEGWNADTLRLGSDGLWYYRLIKRSGPQPEIRLFRGDSLVHAGESISPGAFQNAAMPEALSAAPAPLRELLGAAFALSGGGTAVVVSPDFERQRYFSSGGGETQVAAFYNSGAALAILPDGRGVRLSAAWTEPRPLSLPGLPDGFVYTGIGLSGDTICAVWAEEAEYNIGAAGFMVLRLKQ